MKKLLIITLLINVYGYGQTNFHKLTLSSNFQQLQAVSPSPEMKNLMQFTKTPISEYTGIPDISIPLFDFQCTKDLYFNLQLKYHPDAVKEKERAGSTGLGWSLVGGGSITRVIRGLADDAVNPELGSNTPKRGLHTKASASRGNDLDNFIDDYFYTPPGNMNIYDKLFEAHESGIYDTQYDIFYYNFMGYSGSFYMKAVNTSGTPSVVKLDDNNLKITVQYTLHSSYDAYMLDGFTIFDDKGNKFVFDVKEESSYNNTYVYKPLFNTGDLWLNAESGNGFGGGNTYTSSFHLSTVTPYTSQSPILTFTYQAFTESWRDYTEVEKELLEYYSTPGLGTTYHNYVQNKVELATNYTNQLIGMRDQFGNRYTRYVKDSFVKSQKIKRINYSNKLFIDFTYSEGRIDKNYSNSSTNPLVSLSDINVYSADQITFNNLPVITNKKDIKKYSLSYGSSSSNYRKSLLKKIIEYKNNVTENNRREYGFFYNKENFDIPAIEDKWGYVTSNVDRSTDNNLITSLVLEKMTVPTGGAIIYNYEPHTFSYIGSTPLYTNISPKSRKNEIGGGIRIKSIGYFDDKNIAQNYYTQNLTSPIPSSEISYDYNENATQLSSGSLTFPIPVFEYNQWFDLFGEFSDYNSQDIQYLQPNQSGTFYFKMKTDYNNLLSLTTQGSNVGYKTVSVTERNNGKKVLTFTSPIDFPEENYTVTYPFMPSKNVDYKRGLLLNEKNYNSDNMLISETVNTYDYTENEVNMGLIPFYRNEINCRKSYCRGNGGNFWIGYDKINGTNNCHPGTTLWNPADYYEGLDLTQCYSTYNLMDYKLEKRVVGWAKLSRSERIDYLPNAINNVTEYGYNPINKKPGFIKNIIGSDVYSTEYQYLNVSTSGGGLNFDNRYNRISDVKKATTKFNNEVLATENILFKDVNPANSGGGLILVGSEMYVPEKYQYSKGTNALEDIQTITRMDDRGNPLEVKKADGTFTTFIWGHNKTRLVAVIENCQFSEIENSTSYTSIISNTNKNLTPTVKTTLLNNYNTLRSSLQPKSQMTALIHDMGLGVVTKIDPNGKVVNYNYNNLGNLQEIRDNENNLLKQYFEFYKN